MTPDTPRRAVQSAREGRGSGLRLAHTVRGATAKSAQTRRIPLNAEALAVLTDWFNQLGAPSPDSYVFPGSTGKRLTCIDKAWRSLMKRSEIDDFRFHDCGHHFASRLVQSGVDLNTVRELLGHKDIAMVLRYAHLAPNNLVRAVEKVALATGEVSHFQAEQRAAASLDDRSHPAQASA